MNLECRDVRKSYGSVKALQSADISVGAGEIRALLGGNGSGKSTLAKILGGSVKKDHGEVLLDGQLFESSNPNRSRLNGIIITSQELSLLPNLSVAENLSLCQLPVKGIFTDKKTIRGRAKALLRKWGMEALMEKTVSGLPPNELYLVEFFKALMQEPKVLIIDEITSALYAKDVVLVDRILQELKSQGCAVVFISHRLSEIMTFCDSVTVMRNGQTVVTYPIAETNEEQLLAQMAGKAEEEIKAEQAIIEKGHSYDPSGREILLSLRNFHVEGFESDIDLDVYEGEVIGIAGLQGHGQSGLIRQLFGLSGAARVTFAGKEEEISNMHKAVAQGIGFISGDREGEGTFSEQSLTDNIDVVCRMVLGRKTENPDALLKANNVKYASAKQKITELSGGNQQKVVIGRWTCTKPRLLLADDPTKGIDVNARGDVHKILCGLAEQGSAVMMVSSDDYELVTLAETAELSRIIVMYEGRITKILTGADINVENIAAASMDAQGKEDAV